MKSDIHPKYYDKAKVTCSCGASFEVGATVPELKVEICSACHPLYTGNKKFVDTAGRLDRFKTRLEKSQKMQEQAKKRKAAKKIRQEGTEKVEPDQNKEKNPSSGEIPTNVGNRESKEKPIEAEGKSS